MLALVGYTHFSGSCKTVNSYRVIEPQLVFIHKDVVCDKLLFIEQMFLI